MYFQMGKMSQNLSEGTLNLYKLVTYQLVTMINKELNMITSDDVKVFLLKMKMLNGCSDVTINHKRLVLSSIFSYLHNNDKIARNPMGKVEPVKCRSQLKKPLTDIEVELIFMACDDLEPLARDRAIAMIYFMLDTGVRVSELCALKVGDINMEHRKGVVLGKGNKERWIYFSEKTMVRLKRYLETRRGGWTVDSPLFCGLNKPFGPMHKSGVESILKHIGKGCGVMRLHPHLLRATFATNLSKKGVPIDVIAKLLGHANLNTITRYVLVTDDYIQKRYL
jgi:site-specific recombinase XerD